MIDRTRVVELSDISALVIGVTALIPGLLFEKFNGLAPRVNIHTPLLALYWAVILSEVRCMCISVGHPARVNTSVQLVKHLTSFHVHTLLTSTIISDLSAGAGGKVTVILPAEISQGINSLTLAV